MLWTLAVAMPLLQILADSPDFFVARGNTRWDVVALVVVLMLVPPTLLTALEAVLWRAPRPREYLHLAFVAGLGALVVLQLLSSETTRSSTVLIPLAGIAGVLFGVLYARARFVREMLTVLALGVLALPLWFLLLSPASKLVLPQETETVEASVVSRPAPVVFLLLDEFPADLLMTPERRIDSERYPAFARLARESTWYRNATTVADQTTRAVPAMLSGRRPEPGELPIASDHPNTLFSLLADSHRMEVTESATSLCPESLCARDRPPVGSRLRSLASDLSVVSLQRTLPSDLDQRLPQTNQTFSGFRNQGTDQRAEHRGRGAPGGDPGVRVREPASDHAAIRARDRAGRRQAGAPFPACRAAPHPRRVPPRGAPVPHRGPGGAGVAQRDLGSRPLVRGPGDAALGAADRRGRRDARPCARAPAGERHL